MFANPRFLLFVGLLVFLPACYRTPTAQEPSKGKPRLSKESAITLANAVAKKRGVDLAEFEPPEAEYKPGRWTVIYNGKMKAVGNYFTVWVDDQTGNCDFLGGM